MDAKQIEDLFKAKLEDKKYRKQTGLNKNQLFEVTHRKARTLGNMLEYLYIGGAITINANESAAEKG